MSESLIYTLRGQIDINDLRVCDVNILDIARGLATEYRYSGQTVRPYSVAEHSLLVSYLVPEQYARQALLHDASESYIGDCLRILKYLPGWEGFRELESRLESLIFDRFSVRPTPESYLAVDLADKQLAVTEMQLLYPDRELDLTALVSTYGEGCGLDSLKCLSWPEAEAAFLTRFFELFPGERP